MGRRARGGGQGASKLRQWNPEIGVVEHGRWGSRARRWGSAIRTMGLCLPGHEAPGPGRSYWRENPKRPISHSDMEPFKNEFSYLKAREIAEAVKRAHPAFSLPRFCKGLEAALEPLELKQRMHLIADRVEAGLPFHPWKNPRHRCGGHPRPARFPRLAAHGNRRPSRPGTSTLCRGHAVI
jgi:hypothetical protein